MSTISYSDTFISPMTVRLGEDIYTEFILVVKDIYFKINNRPIGPEYFFVDAVLSDLYAVARFTGAIWMNLSSGFDVRHLLYLAEFRLYRLLN